MGLDNLVTAGGSARPRPDRLAGLAHAGGRLPWLIEEWSGHSAPFQAEGRVLEMGHLIGDETPEEALERIGPPAGDRDLWPGEMPWSGFSYTETEGWFFNDGWFYSGFSSAGVPVGWFRLWVEFEYGGRRVFGPFYNTGDFWGWTGSWQLPVPLGPPDEGVWEDGVFYYRRNRMVGASLDVRSKVSLREVHDVGSIAVAGVPGITLRHAVGPVVPLSLLPYQCIDWGRWADRWGCAAGLPAGALTLGGVPLTLGGAYLTFGS